MATWKFWKRILTDVLGVLLIIAAALFSWVPGPGGIPLLLAGLSLLAINHEWARKWLERVKTEGSKWFKRLFSDHPALMWVVDILGIGFGASAFLLLKNYSGRLTDSLATFLAFLALTFLLSNRNRLQSIINLFKR